MEAVAEYLLSITATGIVCAVVKNFLSEKHTSGKIIQTVTGVFMVITVFSPVLHFRIHDLENYFREFHFTAEDAVKNGTDMATDAMADIIKQQSESYILDKAASIGAKIDIEIKMSDTNPPVPKEVILSGNVSPYDKSVLQQYITVNFSIPEENQKWI